MTKLTHLAVTARTAAELDMLFMPHTIKAICEGITRTNVTSKSNHLSVNLSRLTDRLQRTPGQTQMPAQHLQHTHRVTETSSLKTVISRIESAYAPLGYI